MHLHRSNRTERLVDALAEVVAHPLPGVTERETIVVQSKGMERWLAMQLASRLGVWGNPSFPFPRAVVARVLDAVVGGGDGEVDPYDPEAMTWTLAALLPRFRGSPRFEAIDRYLADDPAATLRLQLADRLARTFDQYVVYRPDMVRAWERGSVDDFQGELFGALVEARGSTHLASRVAACIERLADPACSVEGLPSRLALFGIASLPPLFLDLFSALGRRVEVHHFLLSPSREYFADLRSPRERAAARRHARRHGGRAPLEPAPSEGHLLLASLGKLGREMQELLEERVEYVEGEDLHEDPGGGSALSVLQSDILHLRQRGGPLGPPAVELAEDDTSLAVHCCHGPMREVEVLCDQLLERFEDPSLQPRDVVVMTPDIEAYAPLVEAVFDRTRIPYRIADRGLLSTHAVVDAFFASLEVLSGRLGASAVLDLLGAEAVRARFGIAPAELESIEAWVRAAEVRWGADEAHRRAEGLPASDQNTWRFGLDRLLLGYASSADSRELFAGLLPCDAAEGADADLLGRFVEYCETLFRFRDLARSPRPLARWAEALGELLDVLLEDPDGSAHERQLVRGGLFALAQRADDAGFDEPVALPTVVRHLGEALGHRLPAHGFLAGGVTFCQLVPMRSIPFEWICILGLSDGAFPRGSARLGFDHIAERPRLGDRTPRDDDRHLFLEALLSARRGLYLSYVGRSARGHRELPPSVVVGELLDEARRSFVLPAGSPYRSVEERLVVEHPLVSWSPRYFGVDRDPRLFSYSRGGERGARAVAGARSEPTAFVPGPLPPAHERPNELSLDALVRFMVAPVRAFLAERLELALGEEEGALDDRLPSKLDARAEWRVGSALVERFLEGASETAALSALRAEGRLPLGTPGARAFRRLAEPARAIADAVAAASGSGPEPARSVDFTLRGVRVTGALRDLHGDARVVYGWGKLEGRAELRAWLTHLVLNHVAGPGDPRTTLLVGGDVRGSARTVRFAPVDDAAGRLSELLELHGVGASVPLPLIVEVSRAYAKERVEHPEEPARALRRAREAFEGGDHARGAVEAPEVGLVFPRFSALLDAPGPVSFAEAAERVYGPLFRHRETP